MLLFALLQVFCLPPEEAAAQEKPARHAKKQKAAAPAEQPGLVAAVAAADCGRHCNDGGLRCSLAGNLWFFVLS